MIDVGVLALLISVITLALYTVLLKLYSPKNILVYLFWTHFFTYIGFLCLYLYRKVILSHDMFALEELLHYYSFFNAPLYILLSVCVLASFFVYNKFVTQFDLFQAMALAQLSLFLTALGYLFMGDPFLLNAFVGVIIITYGALVCGMPTFSLNPITLIRSQNWEIIKNVILYGLLTTVTNLITFFLTQETSFNKSLMTSLKHVFPFSFYHPFYFNIGTRLFITLTFFAYLHHKNYSSQLYAALVTQKKQLAITSSLYFISLFTYQRAYDLIPDKNMFSALYKLFIPCLLVLSVVVLQEKITPPKVIGSLIILVGGAITLLL